jgi:hypothetical protein
MRSNVRTHYGESLLIALLASIVLTQSAAAQMRFTWPDTTVQLSKYSTVEQCLAATSRVSKGLARREALTLWRDTMPRDPREALEPLPAAVTETARRCAAPFTEPTADLADFAPLLALYLYAGRDSDAAALVTRRLAAVPAKNARTARAAVSDTAVDIYLTTRPTRLDAAERILLSRARDGADRIDRLDLYARLMTAANDVGDTVRARRVAGWVVALSDSLTKAERESEKFEKLGHGSGGKLLVFGAMNVLTGLPTMLDSLRHSTASLVALERSMWARVTGERPEALPSPVGERAPAITADYWYPAEAASTPRPRPGHVSLLILFDHDACLKWNSAGDTKDTCPMALASLRRLSERFPTLDITIVSGTHGSFLYAPPPTPTDEADMIRKWLETSRIRGAAIAVSSTPFWNLPRPDARRIDRDTPNATNYAFRTSTKWTYGSFLIDQDGVIVAAHGFFEPDVGKLIDVLMHRQQQKEANEAK